MLSMSTNECWVFVYRQWLSLYLGPHLSIKTNIRAQRTEIQESSKEEANVLFKKPIFAFDQKLAPVFAFDQKLAPIFAFDQKVASIFAFDRKVASIFAFPESGADICV